MSYKTQSYANTAVSVIKNLEKRNMSGYYCETAKEARELVKQLIPAQATVTNGGSETLEETGIMELSSPRPINLLTAKQPKLLKNPVCSMEKSSLPTIFSPAPTLSLWMENSLM